MDTGHQNLDSLPEPAASASPVAAGPPADDSPPGGQTSASSIAGFANLETAKEAVLVGAALIAVYLVAGLASAIVTGAYTDDGIYVALGRAIASGHGYHSTYLAGAPVQQHYPPGLPAIYALFWRIGGTLGRVTRLIHAFDLLACGTAAAVLWWIGRVRLGIRRATLLLLVIGPFLLESSIQYFNLAIGEPPFLMLWAIGLLLAGFSESTQSASGAIAWAVGAGLVLGAAILIRTQALAVVPGFMLMLALRRRWRSVAALAVTAIAPLVLWQRVHARMIAAQGTTALHPREWAYIDLFRRIPREHIAGVFAQTVEQNIPYYWDRLTGYLAPGFAGDLIGAAFVLLFVTACVRSGRRRAGLAMMVLATFAMLLLWPIPSPRFVLPVLPFAGLLCGEGVVTLRDAFAKHSRPAIIALACLAMAIGGRQFAIRRNAIRQFESGAMLSPAPPAYFLLANSRYLLAAAGWIVQNTHPSDRIMTGNVGGIHLLTGRSTMWPEPTEQTRLAPMAYEPGEYLARSVTRDGITIVVLDNTISYLARDVAILEEACPDALQLLGSIEAGAVTIPAVFRAQPESPCLRDWLGSLRGGETANPG